MNNGERFAQLFRGYTSRYGRYDLAGRKSDKGKEEGKAKTVDVEITPNDYADHIAGKVGIGVIPLRADDRVNFASIDVDVYASADQERRKLTHEDIALALFDTPLIVTRSKSNGIHIWLFSSEGVAARVAVDYLNMIASKIGVAGSEIFPKQTTRHSDDDIGNWINLPYFGDSRRAVIPNKKAGVTEFIEASLVQFLEIAELAAASVNEEWLSDNTKLEPSQRDGSAETRWDVIDFKDGPPCLQSLIVGHPERVDAIKKKYDAGLITEDQYKKQIAFTAPQLSEGSRDNTFLNVGHYLRRRMTEFDPDAAVDEGDLRDHLSTVHTSWVSKTGNSGIARDIPRLAKQAAKGKWGYSCSKEPLKGFCNRRLCLKRKFGIGTNSTDAALVVSGFTIVESKERQYFMTIGEGKRVHIPDVDTLHSQTLFAKKVLNDADTVWPMMAPAKYMDFIADLIAKADRVAPPPGTDLASELLNLLYDFVTKKSIEMGKNDAGIHAGRVLRVDTTEGTYFEFKFGSFMEVVRSVGIQASRSVVADILKSDLDVKVGRNTHRGNKQIMPYTVTLERLEYHLARSDKADG